DGLLSRSRCRFRSIATATGASARSIGTLGWMVIAEVCSLTGWCEHARYPTGGVPLPVLDGRRRRSHARHEALRDLRQLTRVDPGGEHGRVLRRRVRPVRRVVGQPVDDLERRAVDRVLALPHRADVLE